MSSTPLTLYRPGLAVGRDAQVLHRAASPAFSGWLEHTRPAGGCSRPIRLTGTIVAVDRNTGHITGQLHTDELPDRTLYKACGNRRESVCHDCAWIYRGDAYQVVCRGLTGGKGVPDSVGRHPVVFATFTAPSFGPVHHRHVPRHTCRNQLANTAARQRRESSRVGREELAHESWLAGAAA
ncbi:replication initiator [Micromonospora sp. NPDC047465]|uniref:replication initiator n=1 Tax=Micromonospora sp. NPDC047465 TaxID=3154813 RepID=UPI0033FCDC27